MRKWFPVREGYSIPIEALDPWAREIEEKYEATIEQLADGGGLTGREIYRILTNDFHRLFHPKDIVNYRKKIEKLLIGQSKIMEYREYIKQVDFYRTNLSRALQFISDLQRALIQVERFATLESDQTIEDVLAGAPFEEFVLTDVRPLGPSSMDPLEPWRVVPRDYEDDRGPPRDGQTWVNVGVETDETVGGWWEGTAVFPKPWTVPYDVVDLLRPDGGVEREMKVRYWRSLRRRPSELPKESITRDRNDPVGQ